MKLWFFYISLVPAPSDYVELRDRAISAELSAEHYRNVRARVEYECNTLESRLTAVAATIRQADTLLSEGHANEAQALLRVIYTQTIRDGGSHGDLTSNRKRAHA